jgi:lipopolysaccharide export system permease protein
MRILTRLVAREFFKTISILLAAFITIYLLIDFERIADFVKFKATVWQIIEYYVYKIPLIIFQTIPMAALVGTLVILATLSKHNEIVAMRLSGLSMFRIILPVLFIGFFISVANFFFNEYVVPITNKRVDYVEKVKIEKKKVRLVFNEDQIWFRGSNGYIYNIDEVDPVKKIMRGVVIYKMAKDFVVEERIDAATLSYSGGSWVLSSPKIRRFADGRLSQVLDLGSLILSEVTDPPEDFFQIKRHPDTMGYGELRQYVSKLRAKGYNANRYEVEKESRLSVPWISFVMTLIAASFIPGDPRSGGQHIGICLIIAFSYWIILAMSLSLGRGGALHPLIAAWSANFLFAGIGIYRLIVLKQ